MLDVIKIVNSRLSWIKSQWLVTTTVYEFDAPRVNGCVATRARRAEEYPENRREDWVSLRDQCNAAIEELQELSGHADAVLDTMFQDGSLS